MVERTIKQSVSNAERKLAVRGVSTSAEAEAEAAEVVVVTRARRGEARADAPEVVGIRWGETEGGTGVVWLCVALCGCGGGRGMSDG